MIMDWIRVAIVPVLILLLSLAGRYWGSAASGILAGLPLKGCGVWSSILMGRTLSIAKQKLYLLVLIRTVTGILSLVILGFAANKTAMAIVESMNSDGSLDFLFQ